jgi:hypothetical protein
MSITIKTLAEKALIVRIHISAFNGNIQDSKVTNDTNSVLGVKGKRGSYTKKIYAGEHLNNVLTAAQKLRLYIKRNSLPWLDGGYRLIKSLEFITIKQKIDELQAEFDKAVKEFIDNLQVIQNKDIKELGTAYDPNDYIGENEMREKFGVRLIVEKIADNDFRNSGWDSKIIEEMQANAIAEMEQRLNNGKLEKLNELREALVHFRERLDIGKFKQGSIDNIIESLDGIKNLNISEDSALDKLCDDIKSIIPTDGDSIRENENIANLAKEALKVSIESVDEMTRDLLG